MMSSRPVNSAHLIEERFMSETTASFEADIVDFLHFDKGKHKRRLIVYAPITMAIQGALELLPHKRRHQMATQ